MLYLCRLFYLTIIFSVLHSAISNAEPPDPVSLYQINKASENIATIAPDFAKNFIFCPQGVNAVEAISSVLPNPVSWIKKTPEPLKDLFDQYVFKDDDNEVLRSANFIFSRHVLQDNYRRFLEEKGHPHIFDDRGSYPQAVSEANKIISELTNAALKNIINEEKADFAFIVTNVVYFKAKWGVPCEEAPPMIWNSAPNTSKKVDSFKVGANDNQGVKAGKAHGYSVYSIPVNEAEGKYKFIIAIPDKSFGKKPEQAILDGKIAESCIEAAKTAQQLDDDTVLMVPDFYIEQEHNLKDLFVSQFPFEISQQVFIKVNKNGVEAFADTEMVVMDGGKDMKVIEINEPFAFWVIDEKKSKILFTGTVYHPQYNK
ncbi:MAG: hypothetical protein OXC48_10635 [Endozoicomonadaceae bacterium]|nr:hypothetical protein [Endozoicomonadaceae bacterium]